MRKRPFALFAIPPTGQVTRFWFLRFTPDSFGLPPLDEKERQLLIRSIGFSKKWLDNPVFQSQKIREVFSRALHHPELVQVALCWNQVIIRNYAKNEFFKFSPATGKTRVTGPPLLAPFRNTIWFAFPRYFAMLLHGAGIVLNHKAALFLAPDDGGKTTTSRLTDSGTILNDDQVILRREDNALYLHGTPFGTISGGPKKAPLKGIFLIRKDQSFKLQPARPIDILQFIWNEHRLKLIVLPKKVKIDLFDLLHQACFRIPGYYLHMPRDRIDWIAVENAMKR